MIVPISGKVVIRQCNQNNDVLAGVMHFPDHFVPEECAGYLLKITPDAIAVLPDKIAEPMQDDHGAVTIGDMVKSQMWRVSADPTYLMVRFVRAFDSSNGWSVFGPTSQALIRSEEEQGQAHCWRTVDAGRVSPCQVNAECNGISVSQLFTTLVVWPDINGVAHSVPDLPIGWRQVFLDHALVLARHGSGELSLEKMKSIIRADTKMLAVTSMHYDPDYTCYLEQLRLLSGIELVREMTLEDTERHSELIGRAYKAMQSSRANEKPSEPIHKIHKM